MVKRDRRESDNWKSKAYHIFSYWKTYRHNSFNWLGRNWSWSDWGRGWLICCGCLHWRHRRTDGGDLVNTCLVGTCTNKCQITLATFYKATMCTVSITFTMQTTTIRRLRRWFNGRRYSRRVSFTCTLRCNVLGYFISGTRI